MRDIEKEFDLILETCEKQALELYRLEKLSSKQKERIEELLVMNGVLSRDFQNLNKRHIRVLESNKKLQLERQNMKRKLKNNNPEKCKAIILKKNEQINILKESVQSLKKQLEDYKIETEGCEIEYDHYRYLMLRDKCKSLIADKKRLDKENQRLKKLVK